MNLQHVNITHREDTDMDIIWKKPTETPEIERGGDIKVWGLVDFYRYSQKWGGVGSDGKAECSLTLEKVERRVIEMCYALTGATDAELVEFEECGKFPDSAPGWLDNWVNEDGEFVGINGFYRQYHEEGGMYYDCLKPDDNGRLVIKHAYGQDEPSAVFLAWTDYIRPSVPDVIPE